MKQSFGIFYSADKLINNEVCWMEEAEKVTWGILTKGNLFILQMK